MLSGVKPCPVLPRICILACLLLIAFSFESQDRPIRLRNAVFPEKMSGRVAQNRANNPQTSGLQLIQFRGPLRPEWREQLRASGVELLRYAADDAFIARFRNVRVSDVQALPFVEW